MEKEKYLLDNAIKAKAIEERDIELGNLKRDLAKTKERLLALKKAIEGEIDCLRDLVSVHGKETLVNADAHADDLQEALDEALA